jgi:hypothetical protein
MKIWRNEFSDVDSDEDLKEWIYVGVVVFNYFYLSLVIKIYVGDETISLVKIWMIKFCNWKKKKRMLKLEFNCYLCKYYLYLHQIISQQTNNYE